MQVYNNKNVIHSRIVISKVPSIGDLWFPVYWKVSVEDKSTKIIFYHNAFFFTKTHNYCQMHLRFSCHKAIAWLKYIFEPCMTSYTVYNSSYFKNNIFYFGAQTLTHAMLHCIISWHNGYDVNKKNIFKHRPPHIVSYSIRLEFQ